MGNWGTRPYAVAFFFNFISGKADKGLENFIKKLNEI
jgi:hypothetical protein